MSAFEIEFQAQPPEYQSPDAGQAQKEQDFRKMEQDFRKRSRTSEKTGLQKKEQKNYE